jgi:formylglycine-generating enzyme required for sulfatase activity
MAGNVWEWTWSEYDRCLSDPKEGPEDAKAEGSRVLRGGAFVDNQWDVRCARRFRLPPDFRRHFIGFRVCVAAQ